MLSVPGMVYFPPSPMGKRVTQTLTVSNMSYGGYLRIQMGGLGGPFGLYYPGGYYIYPHAGLQFTISYTPTQTGQTTQTLAITSSDSTMPSANVKVVGGGGY
jgi:hypothetical protein